MADYQRDILDKVPTEELLRAARERNQKLRSKFGRFAAQKRLTPCPGCKELKGVREMRRHKKDCAQYQEKMKQARSSAA